jgi:hypothetical protein
MTDLLADVALWCHQENVDFARCLRRGVWHAENGRHAAERDGDPAGLYFSVRDVASDLADRLTADLVGGDT